MRTTIEMKPEHRAELMRLAAARGEKGFSSLVSDALDLYLETERRRQKQLKDALAVRGSLTDAEAEEIRAEIRKIRAHWR